MFSKYKYTFVVQCDETTIGYAHIRKGKLHRLHKPSRKVSAGEYRALNHQEVEGLGWESLVSNSACNVSEAQFFAFIPKKKFARIRSIAAKTCQPNENALVYLQSSVPLRANDVICQ